MQAKVLKHLNDIDLSIENSRNQLLNRKTYGGKLRNKSWLFIILLHVINIFPQGIAPNGINSRLMAARDIDENKKNEIKVTFNNLQTGINLDVNNTLDFYPSKVVVNSTTRFLYLFAPSHKMLEETKQELIEGYWVNFSKKILTYNASGQQVSCLEQVHDGIIWRNFTLVTNTYNGEGRILSSLEQIWDNEWINLHLTTFVYSTKGKLTTETLQDWISGKWDNYSKKTFDYDDSNNLLKKTSSRWLNVNWSFDSTYIYTYNATGQMLTEEFLDGKNLVRVSRATYTYGSNNKVSLILYEKPNGAGWKNNFRYSYEYDMNNNLTKELQEYWEYEIWKSYSLHTYTYNNNGKVLTHVFGEPTPRIRETYTYENSGGLVLVLMETMGGAISEVYAKIDYTNDINGNCVKANSLSYNTSTNVWYPYPKKLTVFYNSGLNSLSSFAYLIEVDYSNITGIESETLPNTFTLSQNYPNPFNPSTTIKYSVPALGNVVMKLYNSLGQKVRTLLNEEKLQGSYELSVNLSDLSSGVYFYRLSSGNNVQTKKMMLIK